MLVGVLLKRRSCKKPSLLWVFKNVVTYKQSGNVIFEDNSGNVEEIKKKIEN